MGKKRAKKSRRKLDLATAILLAIAAALNVLDIILDRLLE